MVGWGVLVMVKPPVVKLVPVQRDLISLSLIFSQISCVIVMSQVQWIFNLRRIGASTTVLLYEVGKLFVIFLATIVQKKKKKIVQIYAKL